MFATGVTMGLTLGLTEWIIDDTCLVFYIFIYFSLEVDKHKIIMIENVILSWLIFKVCSITDCFMMGEKVKPSITDFFAFLSLYSTLFSLYLILYLYLFLIGKGTG